MGNRYLRAAALVFFVQLAGCGGKVVFEQDDDGSGRGGNGTGGETNTTSSQPSTSTSPVTTNTGPSGCQDHIACGPNSVCLFGTGECVPGCGFDIACPDGMVCNDCGTSSCPDCLDCMGACFPAPPVECDDHIDCGMSIGTDVCVFFSGSCAQRCGEGSPPCPPELFCEPCATSSCPGCDDCIGACIMGFDQ